MADKKISTTVYITEVQNDQLKRLSIKTKVPMAEYIRQGIDIILEKNSHVVSGQLSLLDYHSGANNQYGKAIF